MHVKSIFCAGHCAASGRTPNETYFQCPRSFQCNEEMRPVRGRSVKWHMQWGWKLYKRYLFLPPPLRYWLIIFFRKKIGEWLRTHSLGNSWEFCFILKGSQYELQWFGYQESSVDYCIYCCPRGLIWYGSCFPYFMGEETEAQLVSLIAYGLQTHACLIPEALGSASVHTACSSARSSQSRPEPRPCHGQQSPETDAEGGRPDPKPSKWDHSLNR